MKLKSKIPASSNNNRKFIKKNIKNLSVKKNGKVHGSHSVKLSTDYGIARNFGCTERLNMKMDLNGIVLMQMLNKMKEIELKNRVVQGRKIRVAFFLDSSAKFPGANVYRIMNEHPLFDPFVILYTLKEAHLDDEHEWGAYLDELKCLRKRGFKVYSGYNQKRNFISIEDFNPDIVFVSPFYLDSVCLQLSQTLLNVNFLVCQLNYGFNVCNSYEYHYNNRQVNSAWKYFVETREDYAELRRYSMHFGFNTVLTGSPKMDIYSEPLENIHIPDKMDNGKPIVIYAPHWTVKYHVDVHDLASFDLYKDFFLDLVKKNPQYNFVYKPHPTLETRLAELGIMPREKYRAWVNEWNELPNGLYVFDDSYIELFRKSDLLITDSGSFIFEWLPTGKPCMYLVNPRRNSDTFLEGFSIQARKILQSYYLCHDEEEITDTFHKLMHIGEDPLKNARYVIEKEIFPEIGTASSKIVDYLEHRLVD